MDTQMVLQAEMESFFRLQRLNEVDYILPNGTLIKAATDSSFIKGD